MTNGMYAQITRSSALFLRALLPVALFSMLPACELTKFNKEFLTPPKENHAPVASAQSVSVLSNAETPILLSAVDEDLDELSFTLVDEPVHGTLSGTPPNVVYTPKPGFKGSSDNFTFSVSDGKKQSAAILVMLNFLNEAPEAFAQSVETNEDTAKSITLAAVDRELDTLSYTIVSLPSHGTLGALSGADVLYTPDALYNGTDSFTFKANDGSSDSQTMTVSLTIFAINYAPVAHDQSVSTNEDTAKAITLTATDVENSPLTYSIVTPPAHGSLGTVSGAAVTYTPTGDYTGPDSFTFYANDGQDDSAFGTVSITVNPVNDAPVAAAQAVSTNEDTAKAITLVATDVDSSSLTYSVVTPPTHGSLGAVSGAAVTYTPAANYNGPDSFTFKANDIAIDSNTATVSITVDAVNDAPVISSIADASTGMNTSTVVNFTISDVESTLNCSADLSMSSSVTSLVANSAVVFSGTAPNCSATITPSNNQFGTTSITLTVSDSALSADAVFNLAVNAPSVSISPLNVTLAQSNTITNTAGSSRLLSGRLSHTETLLSNGKVLIIGGYNGSGTFGATATVELYDPTSGNGTIIPMTPLSYSRGAHTATLLSSGKVLVIGGYSDAYRSQVELYDPAGNGGSGSVSALTSINSARMNHRAVLLSSGKVLIVGGQAAGTSVELYDPSGSGSTSNLTALGTARDQATTTLLSNGKVLITGGWGPLTNVELYDPSGSGSRVALTSLNVGRYDHRATLLSNGKVLITGGGSGTSAVELYDPSGVGSTTNLTAMNTSRYGHSATLLASGSVLIAGGFGPTNSVELYNPAGSGSTTVLTSLTGVRWQHTATLLSSGKILFAGGRAGGTMTPINTVELYDASGSGATASISAPSTARYQHTATLLSNGKVLLTGGITTSFTANSSVDLYDPVAGTVSPLVSLGTARYNHTATLLSNGKVLIAGGIGSGGSAISSVELYDPSGSGSRVALTSLLAVRYYHTATLLSSGKILFAGGWGAASATASVELYDPSGVGSSVSLTSLAQTRNVHTATLLSSGNVLIVGGFDGTTYRSGVELYDPSGAGSPTSLTALATGRCQHTATLLSNGKVLIAGGSINTGPISSVELYDPSGAGSRSALTALSSTRNAHTATLLSTGKILITGGSGAAGYLATTELYDPSGSGSTTALGSMNMARSCHTATLLQDGRVFISNGLNGYGSLSDYSVYSIWATQVFTATGGTGSLTLSIPSGTGTIYPSTGLFVPGATGSASVRATDSIGVHDDAVVTIQKVEGRFYPKNLAKKSKPGNFSFESF